MNFNFNFTGLNGNEILDNETGQPIHAGKYLGNNLFTSKIANGLKWNEVARKIYNEEEITLDKADSEALKKHIENSGIPNGIAEQLINAIK